jgi:phosphoribosylanthranilate isomerase
VIRPLVKVCGITRPEDAEAAIDLGADLLGLNFWPGSPRAIDRARGREIAAATCGGITLVGVFVDQDPSEVEEIAAEVGLALVQLHGREPAEIVARFAGRALRVVRGTPDRDEASATPQAWGFLADTPHARLAGGSGESWDWRPVAPWAAGKPVLVAGGIGPENLGAALAATGAAGIDVNSRVESAPGIKDRARLARLFEEIDRHVESESARRG